MFHLTTELFSIPLENNRYLVYAPKRGKAFVANAGVVNNLADIRDDSLHALPEIDTAMIEVLQRLGLLSSQKRVQEDESDATNLWPSLHIFPSSLDDYNCLYCKSNNGRTSGGGMGKYTIEIDQIKRGIQDVANLAAKRKLAGFGIQFSKNTSFLLPRQILFESLSYARQHAETLRLKLRVGCILLQPQDLQDITWICANTHFATVAITDTITTATTSDMPSELFVEHDWLKVFEQFKSHNFPYYLKLRLSVARMNNLAAVIGDLCFRYGMSEIQIEPIVARQPWNGQPTSEVNEFLAVFRRAKQIAINSNCRLIVTGARLNYTTNFCGISCDDFLLLPNGNSSVCCAGKGAESIKSGIDQLSARRYRAIQDRDYCHGCFAKRNCAGDCYHNQLAASMPQEFHGIQRCHIVRELIKDELLMAIANADGMAWQGNY